MSKPKTFRIADTFTDSLGKLGNQEKKAVKTTVFDLQMDMNTNGLRLHKLTGGRDKNFWSVSASMDLRVIIHRDGENVLVCYVDHHDKAYAWARERKLEVHPTTGAAQLVEVAQVEREIVVPIYVQEQVERRHGGADISNLRPLADKDGKWLMRYGVPAEWVKKLQQATEDELLVIAGFLPEEAGEAVIDIATGNTPDLPVQADPEENDPFEHPDALRRFRTIDSQDELKAALDAPLDKWTIFLHPSQRDLVGKEFSGPARVAGSAGTGKTVVALHRAAHLARTDEDAIILLTTFSDALANLLRRNLRRLLMHEPGLKERIKVEALDAVATRLLERRNRGMRIIGSGEQREILLQSAELVDHSFTPAFLFNEWHQVVDAWQLRDWEAYETVRRIGRRKRLPRQQREVAWEIFAKAWEELEEEQLATQATAYRWLTELYLSDGQSAPYDHVVVDEAQDISVPQLRFLAAIAGEKANGLFFSGDLGQRIFQAPFSWAELGVNVRGRASTLRINYRTSHQIRTRADLLLAPEVEDVDGNIEERSTTRSVFNGPQPALRRYDTQEAEWEAVGAWLLERVESGIAPKELAVFVRSSAQLNRAHLAVEAAGFDGCELDSRMEGKEGQIVVSTMHLAKGLEYKGVAVMACDQEVIPDEVRLNEVRDIAEVEEVYNTERHLLYVAVTRARDQLLISCVGAGSDFLMDIDG